MRRLKQALYTPNPPSPGGMLPGKKYENSSPRKGDFLRFSEQIWRQMRDDHSRKLDRPQAKMGPASQAVQGNKGNLLHIVTKHKSGKLNKARPE